ncbi:hypothetical protein KC318_g698 [Hortaea werneckii]|uniref:C2H2 type master regulator of conidiophore development brlA n=1 Tax=Hortaea werneckii TaxID=91943 RepID=A0A3M7BPL0_HORWE|nr:hypothetical protein KC334_g1152 [Hortaea werneckii]KAI7027333.1 hypothetical protein KC355_g374 [Hortaea werneckii]KAI7675829.1 hypothetical protein KC318_g698 [Hortaea werneckii]RMY25852.1 hypothetical protein D0867_00440 [Hortaea werneckii]RMY41576.1 hypothetical protein D0866_00500 [Hortaea werneckii]
MSSPWTAFFGEATYDAGAWNDLPLEDEQYQELYQEIMASDVALNPSSTATYPREIASLMQPLDMYPPQTTLECNLNNMLQDVEAQKDLAVSGPPQVERPCLGEHSMASITAGAGALQDPDNALHLPLERSRVSVLPSDTQSLENDTGVRFERTYAQALRDPCPAEVNGQPAMTPHVASPSQYAAHTSPVNAHYGPTVPAASPLRGSAPQRGRPQPNLLKLSLNTTNLLELPITPHSSGSGTSSPISVSSSRSARRTPDQMRAWPAPFRCDNEGCGFGFETMQDLRHHQRVHKPRRFICETCNKAFHYFKDLRRHWKTHNRDPKQRVYCPFTTCKHHRQGFNRDDHLKRHMEKQHQHVDSALAAE